MKHFIIHWTFPQLIDCLNNLRHYSNTLAITLFRKTSFSSLFLKMALISLLINTLAGSETLLLNQFLILYIIHVHTLSCIASIQLYYCIIFIIMFCFLVLQFLLIKLYFRISCKLIIHSYYSYLPTSPMCLLSYSSLRTLGSPQSQVFNWVAESSMNVF